MIENDDGSIIILPYDGDKWQLIYETPNDMENVAATETIDENSTRWTFDWSKVYGSLKSGEYRFVMGDACDEPNSFLTNGYDKEIESIE